MNSSQFHVPQFDVPFLNVVVVNIEDIMLANRWYASIESVTGAIIIKVSSFVKLAGIQKVSN